MQFCLLCVSLPFFFFFFCIHTKAPRQKQNSHKAGYPAMATCPEWLTIGGVLRRCWEIMSLLDTILMYLARKKTNTARIDAYFHILPIY